MSKDPLKKLKTHSTFLHKMLSLELFCALKLRLTTTFNANFCSFGLIQLPENHHHAFIEIPLWKFDCLEAMSAQP